MSKLKKMLAVISVVVLLSVSTGSIASANLGQKSLDSTPAFLQNTGTVMMTDSDMNHIRGEFEPITLVLFGVAVVATSAYAYYWLTRVPDNLQELQNRYSL